MNENLLLKLKVIVERAVRPVQASLAIKKKMREELLAHATGVLEEELTPSGDETAALIQVEKRLGNPTELAQRLQDSVPRRDRVTLLLEKLIQPRAGESLIRRAVRYGIMLFTVDASLSIALLFLLFPLLGKSHQLGLGLHILLLLSVAFGMITIFATLLINWLQRVLFCTSGRSLIHAAIPMALSCLIPILIPLFLPMAMNPFEPGGRVLDWSSLRGTLPAILGSPLLFVGLAKLFTDEQRYREEWANLQLD